jgi:lyso-ornithine lipid O-acyltransferase
MSATRATQRVAGLTLLTLALLVPALLIVLLSWPLTPLSRTVERLSTRALLTVQRLWSRGVLAVLRVRLHVERPPDVVAGAAAGAASGAAAGAWGADGASAASAASAAGATLLVSNHLSYLDIPVLASLAPCRFVAKSEVADWPVFGFLSKVVRVLFVDRGRRRDLVRVGEVISASLADGFSIVVFPEGTSTRGDAVQPFHPGLLEPAAQAGAPCRALAIHYETPEESRPPSGTICWWGEMTMAPHLWSLLAIARIDARVRVSPHLVRGHDRKQLAASLHAEVAAMFEPVRQVPLERALAEAEEAAPT